MTAVVERGNLERSGNGGVGFGLHRKLPVLLVLLLLGLSGRVMAQDAELRTVFCPIISESRRPTIDGEVTEEEWRESTVVDAMIPEPIHVPSFYDEMHRKAASSEAEWEVLPPFPRAGTTTLWCASWPTQKPSTSRLSARGPMAKPKHPRQRGRDEVSTTDDAVEVTLDLNHNHRDSMTFLAGYSGAQTDIGHPGGRHDKSWGAVWESAVRRGESSWSVEMAIPVRELTGEAIAPGRTLGIGTGRGSRLGAI